MKELVLVLEPERENRRIMAFIATLAQYDCISFSAGDEMENWLSLVREGESRVAGVVVPSGWFLSNNPDNDSAARLLRHALPIVVIDRSLTTPDCHDITAACAAAAPVYRCSLLQLSEQLRRLRPRELSSPRGRLSVAAGS